MTGVAPRGDRFKFSRTQRLQKPWEFERARQEGQRLVKGCLILNWRSGNDRKISRLGIVTSKKIGNAVVRARARRLLREVYRQHQHEIGGAVDLILIARNSIVGKGCTEVERDFLNLARQAKLLVKPAL